MVVLDVSVVNVALPAIRRALSVSDNDLQWVVNAYALAFGGLLLLGGRAADLLGRRRVFIAGMAIFSGASLLGGLSNSIGMLTAARALQGCGAAIVSPATLAILTTTFTEPEDRRRAMGLWGAVAAAGGAVGVLLGGILTQVLSWPWVLFVNVPIGIGVIFVSLRAIRGEPPLDRFDFDLLGALTVTGGLVAIVYAIVRSQTWGFGSGKTIAVFLAGIALLAWFVVQEHSLAAHPLVPLRVFRNRSLAAANIIMFLIGAAIFAAFFFVTLYLQQVRGYSPLKAGVGFLPMALSIVAGSTAATQLIGRLGSKPPLLAGIALTALGMLLFTRLSVRGSYVTEIAIPSIAFGLARGSGVRAADDGGRCGRPT
jgi:EmrB/QacA subfamily drug resistance transporter